MNDSRGELLKFVKRRRTKLSKLSFVNADNCCDAAFTLLYTNPDSV